MTGTTELVLPDPESLADLRRYAARAKTLDPDGAIRLQASGLTLAGYVGVLAGRGVMGEGTLLGLRVSALAEPAELDATVPLAAVTDRTSRPGPRPVLAVPPATVHPTWAALAPPRSGWELVGDVPAETVLAVAREGIATVAAGAPSGSGAAAVATVRSAVWSAMSPTSPAMPAGLAFAAYALGFVVQALPLRLFANGRWTRLSGAAGHALMR